MFNKASYPLIVEPNFEIILEVDSPLFQKARSSISVFCSLIKSPAFFFTYIIDAISLWNGFATGLNDKDIIRILKKYSYYSLPENVSAYIKKRYQGFGLFSLENYNSTYHRLVCSDKTGRKKSKNFVSENKILFHKRLEGTWEEKEKEIFVFVAFKGIFKSEMANLGYIVRDFTDFFDGDPVDINFAPNFEIRSYQADAIDSFLSQTIIDKGGAGTVIMPCGSGKTIVGIGIMSKLATSTLIITPNLVSLKQWKKELIEKTNLSEDNIGEYSSWEKDLKPVTLTTYQIISYRQEKNKSLHFKHMGIFKERNWGLIIYDEIHILPADVFRYTTGVESKRKLGLTATLVREDGRQQQVFSLVGPKKYDLPWKDLEKIKCLAQANCFEIKVAMNPVVEQNYYTTFSEWNRYRIAAENPEKFLWVDKILESFPNASVIIIGQFIDQLQDICNHLNHKDQHKYNGIIPLLTGKTNQLERLSIYEQFKNNEIKILVVSKIANFAVDLPNADIAIQLSGTFGSRQEETQRLGRIIRPKSNGSNQAFFFTIVTKNSREEILAQNRKSFLINQGYAYESIFTEEQFDICLDKFLKKITFTK